MTHRKEVFDALDKVHEGLVIAQGMESSGDTKKRAEQERDRYGLHSLLNDPFHEDRSPRFTQDRFNQLSDEDKRNKIEQAHAYRQNISLSNAIETTSRHLDDVIKDDKGAYVPSLTKLANVKEVIENSPEDSREMLTAYAPAVTYSRLAKKLKDGKALSTEEQDNLKKAASASAYRKQYKSLAGKPEQLRKLGAELAALAPSEEATKEELIDGADGIRKEIEAEMKTRYGDDYEAKVSKGVGESFRKMIKSGDAKKQNAAMSLLYMSERGYGLDERDFEEVFP